MTISETTGVASIPFLDREVSWLEFNRRVLHEAIDPRTPLLERVKFLAIFSSNLDEFFMKRVVVLKRRLATAGLDGHACADGPYQQLSRIRQSVLSMLAAQAAAYIGTIVPELARNGIRLLSWVELNGEQRHTAEGFFQQNVFPVLTPLAVDPAHPFPFISNLSTSLGILLHAPGSEERLFARVKVPDVVPQWIALPGEKRDGRPGNCALSGCWTSFAITLTISSQA
jgi:polyphosphate kinase